MPMQCTAYMYVCTYVICTFSFINVFAHIHRFLDACNNNEHYTHSRVHAVMSVYVHAHKNSTHNHIHIHAFVNYNSSYFMFN